MANGSNSETPKPKLDWAKLLPRVLYGILGLATVGLIGWGLAGKGGFLDSLANKEVARGLITFLIAFTTVAIAVILVISTAFGGDKQEDEEADKRFDRGKQVLTALIGVLGTIVGFYFGSTERQPVAPLPQSSGLVVAPTHLSNAQSKSLEKITISTFVHGGKARYTYSIAFDPPLIPEINDIASTDGSMKQEIAMPLNLDADKDRKIQITVKDIESRIADCNQGWSSQFWLKTK